jgi:uncharacterized protein
MTLFNNRKNFRQIITLLGFLLWSCWLHAELVTVNDCRPAQVVSQEINTVLEHSDAVFWEISRDNRKPSYIFGTIHVSDPKITRLHVSIREKLENVSIYVMEVLPVPEEVTRFSQMMFYDDGTTLRDFLDEELFKRTTSILSKYNLTADSLPFIKPWAAFLIMNYPAEEGLPMDLQLLNIAQQQGAVLRGLETLTEQGDLFSNLDIDAQVQLLVDTVCNYEIVNEDFEIMKSLYIKRDLNALYNYTNKYTFSREKIYQDLVKRILVDRNKLMVKRMQAFLSEGNAFIAIGALHLPGNEGVLSLLENQGYKITAIY